METVVALLGGSLLGGIVGALAAVVTAERKLDSETRQWRQDALVRGMGFLTGGRQERSVGIGLIESLILSDNVPRDVRPAVDAVLWNQLVYVTHEGAIDRAHENVNARRLIDLLEKSPDLARIPRYSPGAMDEIRRRVEDAAASRPLERPAG